MGRNTNAKKVWHPLGLRAREQVEQQKKEEERSTPSVSAQKRAVFIEETFFGDKRMAWME